MWNLKSEEFKTFSHPTEILADILGFGNIPNFSNLLLRLFLKQLLFSSSVHLLIS